MLVHSGLTMVSLLTVAAALASNNTVDTVTVTQTFWSTIVSTPSCPAPTTVTLCNPLSTASTSTIARNANIIYQTLSECHAGQVITIGSEVTTLAQATTWTVEKTISDLVFIPDSATDIDYSAVATVTNIIHPSSMTGMSGQVVVCWTGTTTVGSDHVVLTDCPCTVQSTVLSLTATGIGAVPTALVPSSNYIVKIIYVYVIESIVEQIPTTMTATATSTLTTIQTEIATDTSTTTTTRAPRPTIVSVDSVTFLLEYDTSYEGVGIGSLRKRQASILPDISVELNACLAQCAQQAECVAASLDENTSSCSPLVRFNALSRRNADGNVFAIVIFRPSASTGPPAVNKVASIDQFGVIHCFECQHNSDQPDIQWHNELQSYLRIEQQKQLEQCSVSDIQFLLAFDDFQIKLPIQLKSFRPCVCFVERTHEVDFDVQFKGKFDFDFKSRSEHPSVHN
ncbi:hypothetical protein E4T43_07179 [Aureobasidium subglaciale]|nr:hypothetical protein E4T43_07179 [Aureobasidium subglaciale]